MDNNDKITVSTDKSKLNVDFIHEFLTSCYWSAGISKNIVEKSIEGAICFGIYKNDTQIGFARVISDRSTFAYLADVFIDKKFRGLGYSKILMSFIMDYPELQGLRRFLLATRDAHGLYAEFGFSELKNLRQWMEIHNPTVYQLK